MFSVLESSVLLSWFTTDDALASVSRNSTMDLRRSGRFSSTTASMWPRVSLASAIVFFKSSSRGVSRALAVVHLVSHLDLPGNTLETSLVDSARLGPMALAINRELSQKVAE